MIYFWIIFVCIAAFFLGRMTVRQRGVIVLAGISLGSFRAGVQADLAVGRKQFEATRTVQIRALTLTHAEMAVIKPRKR